MFNPFYISDYTIAPKSKGLIIGWCIQSKTSARVKLVIQTKNRGNNFYTF